MINSSDLSLVRLLEAVEAESGRLWAESQRQANDAEDTEVEEFAGGVLVFAGVGSPGTHALGIGMHGPISPEDFDNLEEFFRDRGSEALIDLCPMAHPTVVAEVMERQYRVVEFNNVMVRRLSPNLTVNAASGIDVRGIYDEEEPLWRRIMVRGFLGQDEPEPRIEAMLTGLSLSAHCFLGETEGRAAATGAMGIRMAKVAHLFGDATLVGARGRGLQHALIEARLAAAAKAGCEYATAAVIPGSSSHRNYERAGFRLIYMRVNVARNIPSI